MNKRGTVNVPTPTLEGVKEEFLTWRITKKNRRTPIPTHLWEASVHLTKDYSISEIVKALHLNYTDLKKRASPNRAPVKSADIPPTFLEIPPISSISNECVVEMERSNGCKMRMHFKGKPDLDLQELSKTFWRQ